MNHKFLEINKIETGFRIYNTIQNKHFTYERIASLLGFNSTRIIYYWTSGKKLPTVEHLLNLSKILDVKMEDLLYFS